MTDVIPVGESPYAFFTSKERDSESNLDYFGARYFSGAQGRFATPDDIYDDLDPSDPATRNRYVYVRNNPLRYVDPNGEDAWDIVNGLVNAVGSNGLLGAGRVESGNADFKTGQAIGDAISVVVGMAETNLGAGGNVVGFSLDATGAGAVVGVPINVVSSGAMLHGASMSATGMYHLSKSAGEQDTTTQGAQSNSSDSSGRYSGRYADGEKAHRTNVPRDAKTGVPTPDPKAQGPHSRLQPDAKKPGRVYSATEFNGQGQPVKRIDFAGRKGQQVPHQHRYDPQKKTFRKEHEPLQQ
jgi:RHS repeat-associated protein